MTVLLAQNSRARLTLRTNLIKLSRDELLARLHSLGLLAEKTPLGPWGVVLDTHLNVYSLPPYEEGLCEVQDESSQLVAELCAPPPGSLLVDACAGAGGKTLALAAMMHNRGRILAFDVDEHKLRELKLRGPPRRTVEHRDALSYGRGATAPGRRAGRRQRRRASAGRCAMLGAGRAASQPRGALATGTG